MPWFQSSSNRRFVTAQGAWDLTAGVPILVDAKTGAIFNEAFARNGSVVQTAADASDDTVVTSPSGVVMPTAALTGWNTLRTEDFNTNVALGNWPGNGASPTGYPGWGAYLSGWPDTRKNNGDVNGGTHRPESVLSVSNSCLDWFIYSAGGEHKIAAPTPPWTGPGVEGGHLYGRYSVRMKSDLLPAYKTAWLLWPDSEVWPRDGEIDFPEGDLDWQPDAYVHYQDAVSGAEQDVHDNPYGDAYAQWHTYTIEWWPDYIKFLLDGKGFGTTWWRVPNTPMHWVLQCETTLGVETIPSNATAGHVKMDWLTQHTHNSAYTPPRTIGSSKLAGAAASTAVVPIPTIATGNAVVNAVAGDLLVATITTYTSGTITPPAGWTQIGTTQSVSVPGPYTMQEATYMRTHDGSSTTYTFQTPSALWREAVMTAFKGQQGSPIDAQTQAVVSTASNTATVSSLTATDADVLLWVASIGDSTGGRVAVWPNEMGWGNNSDSTYHAVEPVMPGATGTRTATAVGGAQNWASRLIAIK